MTLVSRKGTPDNPCRLYRGLLGCFTTGWQDTVELSRPIDSWMKRWPDYARAVQRAFKRHARNLPAFLPSGHEHETRDTQNNVSIVTECSSGAPSWDLNRPGYYFHEQCNLYTRIAHL